VQLPCHCSPLIARIARMLSQVVFRDKIVEVPVERVVEKEVIRYVDRFFDREVCVVKIECLVVKIES